MMLIWLILLLIPMRGFSSVELGSKLKGDITTPKVRIVLGLDTAARFKYVENLKTELHTLQQDWGNFTDSITHKISEIDHAVNDLKSATIRKSSNVVIKKINVLQKISNILIEIKDTKTKILDLLQQHIEYLSQQMVDVSKPYSSIEDKSLYSFTDFQHITKKQFVFDDQMNQLLTKKDELVRDIARQEHLVATKERDLGTIEQVIEEKKRQSDINKDDITLLDLEKELVVKERELASLQLIEMQKQLEIYSSKESVLQERSYSILEHAEIVRNRLYIDLNEVHQYEYKYNEQKKISDAKITEESKERSEIVQKKIEAQDELDRLTHRFKTTIAGMEQFCELDKQYQTVSDRFALYSVAAALSKVQYYDRMLQKIKMTIAAQESLVRHKHVAAHAIKLLYDIVQGHGKDSESFEKERSEYKALQQTLQSDIKRYKNTIVALHSILKDHQNHIEYCRTQLESLRAAQSISSSQQKKAVESVNLLARTIQDLDLQYEVIIQISDIYEQLLHADEESMELVITILHEFDMIGVWHRSISAVTWDGIKNLGPNIKLFVKDVYIIVTTYISQLTMQKIAYGFASFGFGGMLAFFLMLFGWFLLYLFLQALFPSVYKVLTSEGYDDTDPLYRGRHILAIFIGFCGAVFKPLYVWFLCFVYEFLYDVPVALLIFFYIYSIVFWIYASRKLLMIILAINRKFDYFLLSKRLIDRFSLVFSFFSIATIIILVMRKMFMVVMAHQQTELPDILLRVYHLVIFISIIFSLDKDEIVQWFPKKSVFMQRVADILDRYYYLFLIGIFSLLIMCDPYLGGYGSLLWHVFWNLFLTALVCVSLFLLYVVTRKYSIILFFHEQDGTVGSIERFDHAKTWYAIYVIASMAFFGMVAVVLCSHVWGYGFTYATLRKIALTELFKTEAMNSAGKIIQESFKVFNLLYILFVTFLGILTAYIVKRFVLQRVFDIQYVDPGIQNTIIIISRYVIIITAVTVACIQSKLGSLVTYVSYVALVVFGWSFKDLFTDFVAYFFILVQRPVKMGDYVKISDETMGVVRKVGPRAVILRRKNSVSIVVPNSTILKSSLYNWNYTRSYIGFDDIIFSVPFGTDIVLVRNLCFEVLDEDSDVLKVPQPFVRLQDFGDKGYVFLIRGFLSAGNTLRQWDIASNVRFALVAKLGKHGITIAGPSMKVYVNKSQDHPMLDA